jgi:hypothetical protein
MANSHRSMLKFAEKEAHGKVHCKCGKMHLKSHSHFDGVLHKKHHKKMTLAEDTAYDKKHGIKEHSAEDEAIDKAHGVKDKKRGKKHHKNWIKGAIGKKGALRKELGAKKGQNIPAGKLAKAAKKGGKEGKRARLAETLKGFHHKHK